MRNFAHIMILLLLTLNVKAQDINYRFKKLSTADGLSQMTVINIHQDQLGQMWFGTRNGLNKYDGTNFKIYRYNANDSLSISNDDINVIEEDSSGYLWIGTYNGLNRYDPKTNIFKRYFQMHGSGSLSNNTIWSIKELKNEIWIGTSKGLNIYNKSTDKFTSIYNYENDPASLPGNFIFSILEAKNGEIWVGTNKGLCKLISRKNGNYKFKRYSGDPKNNDFNSNLYVKDIKEDANNNLWIATKLGGLYKYDQASDQLISLLDIKKYSRLSPDFRAICFDNQGNLWLGTYTGLSILYPDGTLQTVSNHKGINPEINKIKSIYTDKKGSVWIGTYYGGVYFWDKSNANFTNINQYTSDIRLNYNAVGSIVENKEKNIYIGLEGGGISVIENKTGNSYFINKNNCNGLASDYVTSLCATEENDLWIGTAKSGLSVLNLTTHQFKNKIISENLQSLLKKSEGIYDIKEGPNGKLWIGCFELGLIRYDIAKKTFKLFQNQADDISSLSSNRVKSVLISNKNQIWIGTQYGLNLLHTDQKGFKTERFFYNNETGSGENVFALFKDSKNQIWVSLKSKGLFIFNGLTFEKVEIRTKEEQISTIIAILEDSQNNLWFSSNQGILKFNPSDKSTIIYNQTNDLGINEFDPNTGLKFNASRFYFGGSQGITYFDPENIYVNSYAPKTLLTDIKIKNKSLIVNGEDEILKNSISFTNKIVLDFDNANFTLDYAMPNFVNSKKNRYEYRMIGLDKEWIMTSQTQANFTIQNPGTYYFEVKGANNDGVWHKDSTKLEIIVLPAPWRSIWAYILYAFLMGIALYSLVKFVKSKSKLRLELELEQMEKTKKEDLHQAKLQFFTNISHEFKTPLTLILGPLQNLLLNYKGSRTMYKSLLTIESNGKHLLHLINRLMDFRKLENDQDKMAASKGDFVEFLQSIYASFTEFAMEGNYTYQFNSSDELLFAYYDHNKLGQVFYNLISNAFRYTPKGGEISVNIINNKKHLLIEVIDTGVGIEDKYIDKIFNRFFEVPKDNIVKENYNKGTGIGLSIAKSIVKLHKGTIMVKNNIPHGVVFSVVLPLGKDHLLEDELLNESSNNEPMAAYEPPSYHSDPEALNDISDLKIDKDIPTILLVEDNETLRSFIKDLLQNDYNILEAENGKIALEKTLSYMPDLIISDIVMPVMQGTELCKKIKENIITNHIPVVLLTSKTSLSSKLIGLESGADEYISKPFDINELKLRVKNILASKQKMKNKFLTDDYARPEGMNLSTLDEKLQKKAFQIIEDNISNDQFDIPSFSSELGVSRTMLFTKIKAWTNLTPNEFIQDYRLKRAAQFLELNKFNISQICYKVGFKNPKYFSKCFQKKYGNTPSQYQDQFSDSFMN